MDVKYGFVNDNVITDSFIYDVPEACKSSFKERRREKEENDMKKKNIASPNTNTKTHSCRTRIGP